MRDPVVHSGNNASRVTCYTHHKKFALYSLREMSILPNEPPSSLRGAGFFLSGTGVRVRSRRACQTLRRHRVLFGLQRQRCRFGRLHERSSSPVRTAVPRCRFGRKSFCRGSCRTGSRRCHGFARLSALRASWAVKTGSLVFFSHVFPERQPPRTRRTPKNSTSKLLGVLGGQSLRPTIEVSQPSGL